MNVTRDRWQAAQLAELNCWSTGDGANMCNDRNIDHMRRFRCYDAIDSFYFPAAIELGCGPFTNMRFIRPVVAGIGEIHLLDPLASDYYGHKWCRYGELGEPTVHHCSIEDFVAPRKYDLVVMINVMAHCMDSEAVFAKVLEIMEPHGVLIFHESTCPANDEMHPLNTLPADEILNWVANNFTTQMCEEYKDLMDQKGRRDFYVIGQRR